MIGSETGLYLATLGRRVTIVDQLPGIALEENAARRRFLLKHFEELHVETVVNATIREVAEGAVTIDSADGTRVLPCDTVVLALGMTPDVDRLDSLRNIADVRVIGDAAEASDALVASREGFRCGLSL